MNQTSISPQQNEYNWYHIKVVLDNWMCLLNKVLIGCNFLMRFNTSQTQILSTRKNTVLCHTVWLQTARLVVTLPNLTVIRKHWRLLLKLTWKTRNYSLNTNIIIIIIIYIKHIYQPTNSTFIVSFKGSKAINRKACVRRHK